MSAKRNQYLACFCVNLTSLSYGLAIGWSSPSLPVLLSTESPLITGAITLEQASWINSMVCIGGGVGAILIGFVLDLVGRKNSLLCCGAVQIISWLLIPFVHTVFSLYLSRFLAGFAGGAFYVIIPVFITEMSNDDIRGTLGSFLVLATNLGCVIGFVIGAFVEYLTAPFVGLTISVLFFIWMLFIPETPIYLLVKKNISGAENALKYYSPKLHVNELVKTNDNLKDNEIRLTDFYHTSTKWAILISVVLMVLSEFSGVFVIISYTSSIFRNAGAVIHPNLSTIIVGSLQLAGSYTSAILVDRVGRKMLLSVSSFGTCLSLILMGTFSYLKHLDYDVNAVAWIPLLCLSSAVYISAIGMIPLPYVVASEILPQNLRGPIVSTITVLMWITAFTLVKYFHLMLSAFMLYGCMWIFGGFCLIFALFTLGVVPETKGKSFVEIANLLENKK